MKLLFDQNLSPRLVEWLADLFPGSSHVSFVGLDRARDTELRADARANGFMIVTKDADFSELAIVRGFPPKVIWLRLGNCTNRQVEQVLRDNYSAIAALATNPEVGVITVF
ncbi:MAG: DUF5615 family PIN-like protein [Dehalococcoidia bacterium]